MKSESGSGIELRWIGGLAALCVLAYIPAWIAFFVKDDLALISSARLAPGAVWFHTWPGGFFRPIAELLFAVEYWSFGFHPLPYHLVSWVAHLGSAFFVYRLFNLLAPLRAVSFFAAALFALHPLNTETVSWISGQMSLFASLCTLIVLYILGMGRRWGVLIPVFVLGLGFYENFLLVLLLWGVLCLFDDRFRSLVRPVPLLVLGLCSGGYLYWRFGVLGLGGGYYQASFSIKTALVNMAYYLYLLVGGSAVGGRIIRYRLEDLGSHFFTVFTPLFLVNTLLLIGCFYIVVRSRSRPKFKTLLPALWIFVALLPTVLLPERPRRLAYLAVPGFALVMGQVLCYVREKICFAPWVAKVVIAVYALVLSSTLYLRNLDWYAVGSLERSFPEVVTDECRQRIFDMPNLVGDALFFNSISTAQWMRLNGENADSQVFAPFEWKDRQCQIRAECYYRYDDGLIRPVREVPPRPIFSRGRNWADTP